MVLLGDGSIPWRIVQFIGRWFYWEMELLGDILENGYIHCNIVLTGDGFLDDSNVLWFYGSL